MADGHTPTCPNCGYDLSGPIPTWRKSCPMEGVCTECGLEFAWGDVLDTSRRAPRWHIEARPIRFSLLFPFRQTFRMMLPWRFWGGFSTHVQCRPLRAGWLVLWPFLAANIGAVGVYVLIAWIGVFPSGMPPIRTYAIQLLGTIPAETLNTFAGHARSESGYGWPVRFVVLLSLVYPAVRLPIIAMRRRSSFRRGVLLRAFVYSFWFASITLSIVPLTYFAYGVFILEWSMFTNNVPITGSPLFSKITWVLASLGLAWIATYWHAFQRRHLHIRSPRLDSVAALLVSITIATVLVMLVPWEGVSDAVQSYYRWFYARVGV